MIGYRVIPAEAGLLESQGFPAWLAATEPEWFRDYLDPSPAERGAHFSRRLASLAGRPGCSVWTCERQGRIEAAFGFERQDWDSNHFGFECARLTPLCLEQGLDPAARRDALAACLGQGLDLARKSGVRLLQRRLLSLRQAEIWLLEALGFYLADNVVVLLRPVGPQDLSPAPPVGLSLRPARLEDEPAVQVLARGTFPHSRFVQDPLFGWELGEAVYSRWIESLFRELAEKGDESHSARMLVAECGGALAGYAAFRLEPDAPGGASRSLAEINLIGTDPRFSGRGVGSSLVRAAVAELAGRGAALLEASTWMNNRQALALYQKTGFRVVENLFTFHHRFEG